MREEKFFKLANVEIKNQISEVRKKCKTKVWIFDVGQKMAKYFFFQEMRARAWWSNFLRVQTRNHEFFMLVRLRFKKQVSEVQKKVKKLYLKCQLGSKIEKKII